MNIVGPLFSASIALNVMAAILVITKGNRNNHRYPFFSLINLAIATILYQVFAWLYHSSDTVNDALFWLRWLTAATLYALPTFFYIFALWSRQRNINFWFWFATAVSAILFIINLFSPHTLRFSNIEAMQFFELFGGSSVSALKGQQSTVFYLYFAYSSCILLWAIYRLFLLYKMHKYTIASFLTAYLVLQVTAAYIGPLVDYGNGQSIYVAGFSLTFLLMMISVNIAFRANLQSRALVGQISRRMQIEKALALLAEGVSSSNNKSFYNEMVLSLQKLFNVNMAFIGIYSKNNDKEKITTIAAVQKSELIENFEYMLADTPCSDVREQKICLVKQGVSKLYPDDKMLTDGGFESYLALPIYDDKGETLGIVALLHDTPIDPPEELINTLQVFASRASAELIRDKVEKALLQLAYIDQTTQLPNRAKLFESINRAYEENYATQKQAVLMLFDLDKFKEVNRVYGYDIAEQVLITIGKRFINYTSINVFIARNGGNEFAVLVTNLAVNSKSVISVQWEAVRAIIRQPIVIGQRTIKVDCSMGAVTFPEQVEKQYELIRSAESALQQAKSSGRGQYRIFDPIIQQQLDEKVQLERLLKQAINTDSQLQLYFQPQTDKDGSLIGAEVLMRWIHPEKGFISPLTFIAIAEESGLIHSLGNWIIRNVFKQIANWREKEKAIPPQISINVSALQLSDENFAGNIVAFAEEYSVDSTMIMLEITESGILANIEQAILMLNQLRELGFKIALDDFGTGYSSLSYLKELPLDEIKIDKSFVDEIHLPSSKALVESIIAIGKHMNLQVIAEGTESLEQVEQLANMNCSKFQGYYFSKPLPANEFIVWIST